MCRWLPVAPALCRPGGVKRHLGGCRSSTSKAGGLGGAGGRGCERGVTNFTPEV